MRAEVSKNRRFFSQFAILFLLTGTSCSYYQGKEDVFVGDKTDAYHGLLTGVEQLQNLCSRKGHDKLSVALCSGTNKEVTSITELQEMLGLEFKNLNPGKENNGANGNPAFALTANSTSLTARLVSAANPRVVIMSPVTEEPDPNYAVMSFTRGEQTSEIIVNDPVTNIPVFYLVRFEQDCNVTHSCKPGDLLTKDIERSWKNVTYYEDVDLKNSVLDCRHCHQPNGPGTQKILRMQEIDGPWTHWLRLGEPLGASPGGESLTADFHAVHGFAESFGGIPAAMIDSSEPERLQDFIIANSIELQPNEFFGSVESQVGVDSSQPFDNSVPGNSDVWNGLFAEYASGHAIPVPYHDVKVTEASKLSDSIAAYSAYLSGSAAKDELPNTADVLKEEALQAMGIHMVPGISGEEIVMRSCAQCHNTRLDQSLTRARFNVDLKTMARSEKQKAIARLNLPDDDIEKMPPVRFRSLTSAEIQLATEWLSKE